MSWITDIQGVKTLKSQLGTVFQQRSVLKVGGLPVSDNGTEAVINGVQTILGTGTWDGKSGVVLVKGSGGRTITIPDPTDPAEGTTVRFVDALANSGAGTITLDPAGSNTIAGSTTSQTLTVNGTSKAFIFISTGAWQLG